MKLMWNKSIFVRKFCSITDAYSTTNYKAVLLVLQNISYFCWLLFQEKKHALWFFSMQCSAVVCFSHVHHHDSLKKLMVRCQSNLDLMHNIIFSPLIFKPCGRCFLPDVKYYLVSICICPAGELMCHWSVFYTQFTVWFWGKSSFYTEW